MTFVHLGSLLSELQLTHSLASINQLIERIFKVRSEVEIYIVTPIFLWDFPGNGMKKVHFGIGNGSRES